MFERPDYEDGFFFLICLIINMYIIFLSALINSQFKKGKFRYSKLRSQIYEIYGFAKEYLVNQVNSENPFLNLVSKQLRLYAKIIHVIRKVRKIFRFKTKFSRTFHASKTAVVKTEKEIIEIQKVKLKEILLTLKHLQMDIEIDRKVNAFRIFGLIITFPLIKTAAGALISYLLA